MVSKALTSLPARLAALGGTVGMSGFADDISRLIPHLRRFARALVRGHAAAVADDLVQETLVLAMRAERLARGSDVASWCFSTMMRLHRQHGAAAEPVQATAAFLPRDIAAFDHLPLEEREVLLLVVLAGFTYARAAATLHVTLDTVMMRLDQARHRLARSAPVSLPREVGGRTAMGGSGTGHGAGPEPGKPARTPAHLRLVK